jgi:hypothetical protein
MFVLLSSLRDSGWLTLLSFRPITMAWFFKKALAEP